jgi:hypothetical protein
MRTVIGYDKNRRPIYRDDGPAFARVQGHGGAQLGFFQGVVIVPRKPKADPEARDRRSVT